MSRTERSVLHNIASAEGTKASSGQKTVTVRATYEDDNVSSGTVIHLTRASAARLATEIMSILLEGQ